MSSLNKVQIIGNLGRDPEVRYTGTGKPVCTLNIATSEQWKDRETGDKKEAVEWHRVVVFGPQAESSNEHLKKGSPVYVEGKLQTRSWEDKDGNKRYTTEILARHVMFLGRKPDNQQGPDEAGNYPDVMPDYEDYPDDVPF